MAYRLDFTTNRMNTGVLARLAVVEPLHVYPPNDTYDHRTDCSDCWCRPCFEKRENGALLIIHNAHDNREFNHRDLN